MEKNSERCPSKAFSDLDCSRWYHEGVDFALAKGFMNGMDTGIFSPDTNITRGQLVTVLYRMEGEPAVEGQTHPFTDVDASRYYGDAITWAANRRIRDLPLRRQSPESRWLPSFTATPS